MFKKIYLFVILTALFSAVSISAQSEYEAANSSNLTSASLPPGALRVFPNFVPAEIDGTLEKLVSASSGKLRRGDTEVLLWTGNDLKRTGAQMIVSRLTDSLQGAGWRYEVGGTENDVTFFSLFKDGSERRAIIGLHGEADGTLLFAMTELHAGGDEQRNSNPTPNNSNPSGYNGTGSVGDYSFTTPAGWSRSDSGNKIVLSKDGDKKIEFLPLMDSSVNLERDAQIIFGKVFKEYDAWYANGFEADWGKFEKGKTAQGLEYYQTYRYIKKIGDANNGLAQSKRDAVILLVKVGGKVAVVAGTQPFQTDYSSGTMLTALDFILYDLAFKSVTGSYNLKNDLLGSWAAASGAVGLAYTFNADNTFHKGGAFEFRTQRDRDTQNVTTTSYGMTQSYSLSGNLLTQNYRQTGETVKYKIRIYYTKYDKNQWQHKIGFLPLGGNEGGTIVMQRSE